LHQKAKLNNANSLAVGLFERDIKRVSKPCQAKPPNSFHQIPNLGKIIKISGI